MSRTTSVFLCDAISDRYGAPRTQREELVRRIAHLKMKARWSDRDDAAELEQLVAEAEEELRKFDQRQT